MESKVRLVNRQHSPLQIAFLSLLLTAAVTLPALAQKAPEIPAGATIRVRIIDKLTSEEAQVGDTFHGTLDEPIEVDGKQIYPKGADVMGRVTDVHRSGRLSEPGELDLILSTVSSGTVAASLHVQPLVIKGESHTKSNVTKIGGGAALGAVIGAIAGGGKGAAIGAGVGGAAGTGAAAATGKREVTVEPEAVLAFVAAAASESTSGNPTPATSATAAAPATPAPAPVANPAPAPDTKADDTTPLFTLRDRRVIRNCVSEHASDFEPGITQRAELPPGSERQIRRGGTLSVDVQKKAASLPLACVEQLPKLSSDLDRVVYNGRVLLIDSTSRIRDMFYLDESQ